MRLLQVIAAILAAAALIACDSDEGGADARPSSTDSAATARTTPSATQSATDLAPPTPEAAAPLEVRFFDETRRVSGEYLLKNFSPNTDGGPNELDRAGISEAGEELRASLHHGDFGDLLLDAWRNIAYPPLVTGGPVLSTLCVTPEATCGGLEFATPRASSALFRSDDVGASWERVDDLDGPYYIRAWSADGGQALLWDQTTRNAHVVWPEMAPVTPPPGSLDLGPVMLPDGRIAWWMPGIEATATWEAEARPDLVAEDGEVILSTIDAPVPTSISPLTVLLHLDGARAVVTWADSRYWTLFEGTAEGAYDQGDTLLMPEGFHGTPFTWLSPNELLFPMVRGSDDSGAAMLDIQSLEAFWLELPPAPEGLSDAPYMPVAARPLGE